MIRLLPAFGQRPIRSRAVSRARLESNAWLREQCGGIRGRVLSIGSGDDQDHEGCRYRDYFPLASEYVTSEVDEQAGCELVLDVRAMDVLDDGSFDCVFCSGVLEHVDDPQAAMAEIERVLRPGGLLLLGVPFRQAIHMRPNDFWRFTEYGVRVLLERLEILEVHPVDDIDPPGFPAAYWTRAVKRIT